MHKINSRGFRVGSKSVFDLHAQQESTLQLAHIYNFTHASPYIPLAPIVHSTRCTCYLKLFILVKHLHVLDGLSVHHQELKTAYTATVYVKELLLPAASSR